MGFPAVTLERLRRGLASAADRARGRARSIDWRSRRSLTTIGVGTGVVAIAAVSAALLTDGGPDDAARAAATLTPPRGILHVVARQEETAITVDASLRRTEAPPVVTSIEEWSGLPEEGTRVTRSLVTTPAGAAVSDTVLARAAGQPRDVLVRWAPGGDDAGALAIGAPRELPILGAGIVQVLADAYRDRRLGSAGKTLDGDPLFIGKSLVPLTAGVEDCADSELVLDPATFAPRRLTVESGCAQPGETSEVTRIVVEIERVETLPDLDDNRARLRIDARPVASATRYGDDGEAETLTVADALRIAAPLRGT